MSRHRLDNYSPIEFIYPLGNSHSSNPYANYRSHGYRRQSNDSGHFSDFAGRQTTHLYPIQPSAAFEHQVDALNDFQRQQNDYYNGKLVKLENNLRYLRAENARLASRQHGLSPDSHYRYEQQPDASIHQLEQLKRRNAQLESAALRLESGGRNQPIGGDKPNLADLRRDYERRRTRDLAENGRQLEEKERELERLRRHYEGLQYMTRSNANEKEALNRMLQTAQRERLTLQHQLSWNQAFFSDASTEDRLKRLTDDIRRVELAREELDEEIRRLRESAVRVKSLKQIKSNSAGKASDPEGEVEQEAKQAQQKQRQKQLTQAFKGAGREANKLQFHMAELELIMKHMRDSLERKLQLDQEGDRVKRLIDRKSRNFLASKSTDSKTRDETKDELETLRSQLRDLEKRSELQSLRHEELLLELEVAKKHQRSDEIRQLSGGAVAAVEASTAAAAASTMALSASRLPRQRDEDSESADYQIPWTDLADTSDDPVINDGDFFALRQAPVGGSESEGWQPSRQSPADAQPPDGYMFGELVDGKSGYIPSNFVKQFASDSPEAAQNATKILDSNPLLPGEWRVIVAAPTAVQYENSLLRTIAGATDTKDGPLLSSVSPPRELRIERQMASSVLISWRQPAHDPASAAAGDAPVGFEVLLDGRVRSRLNSIDKTRALLESVPSNERHRVSVCSVTASGRKSDEASCTISLGGGPESKSWLAPTSLQISHLTGKSAVLAYVPAVSALPHSVLLNGVETLRCEAGGRCRVRFDSLSPNTVYRVEVRALPSASAIGRHLMAAATAAIADPPILTAVVEFRTGLGLGRPEPPTNVQLELGPQKDTLLVTWTPLSTPESNGTRLGGYVLYADSTHLLATCMRVDSDHCVVAIATLPSDARVVTCRSVATDQDGRVVESEDSSPGCELSDVLGAAKAESNEGQPTLPLDLLTVPSDGVRNFHEELSPPPLALADQLTGDLWLRHRDNKTNNQRFVFPKHKHPTKTWMMASANEFGILVNSAGLPILSTPKGVDGQFLDADGNPLVCRRVVTSIDPSTGEHRLLDKLDGLPVRGLRLGPNGVLLDESGQPVRGESGEFFGANHQPVYGRRGADGELLDDEGRALQQVGLNSFGVLADLTTGQPVVRPSDGALLDAHGQPIDCRRCEPSVNQDLLVDLNDGKPVGVTSVNLFGVLVDSQGRPLRGPLGEFYGPNRLPVYGGLRGPDGQLIDPKTGGQRRTRVNEFGALVDAGTGEPLLGPNGQLLNSRAQPMPSRRVRLAEPTEEGGQPQLVDAETGEPLAPETDWLVNEHGVLVDAKSGLALRGANGEFFGPPDGLTLAGGPRRDADGRLVRADDSSEAGSGKPLETKVNNWGILVEVVSGESETAEERPILSSDGKLLDGSGRIIDCRTVPATATARARFVDDVAKNNGLELSEHGVVIDTASGRPVRSQAAGEFLGADGRPVYGPRDADGRLTIESKLNEFGVLVDATTGEAIVGPRGELLDANGQAIACELFKPNSNGELPAPPPGQDYRLNAHGVLINSATGLPVRDSSGRFYGLNRRPVYGERLASGKLSGSVRVGPDGHLVDAEGNPVRGPAGELLDAKGQPIDEASVEAATAAVAASASSEDPSAQAEGAVGQPAAAATAATVTAAAETGTDAVDSAEAAAETEAGGEELEAATIATETTEAGAQADFEDEPQPDEPGFFGRIKKGFQEFQEKVEEFAEETNEKMKEFNEETKRKMEAFNEDTRKKFEEFGEGTKKTFENFGDSTAAAFKKLDPKNLGENAEAAPEEAAAAP